MVSEAICTPVQIYLMAQNLFFGQENMKIEHIAIWCRDLEKMRHFYMNYFQAASNEKYINAKKGFSSYFLSFNDGARLELMQMNTIADNANSAYSQAIGLTHIAFKLDSDQQVELMTKRFELDGFELIDGPRRTGDGYYESVILDPEGNRIEITA